MSAILLIDDDDVIAAILERVLTSAGHTVRTARRLSDGREALATTDFDVVLLDVNLPDGNGLDFISTIREAERRRTPIIMLSGMRQEEAIVRGFGLGADDYVTKPFSPFELVARVDRWTQG